MAYTPLFQSKVSDPRGGRGMVLAVDGALSDLWDYVENLNSLITALTSRVTLLESYNWGEAYDQTISSGVATFETGYFHYQLDTEGAAATDSLTSFADVPEGLSILVRSTDAARVITVVNGSSLKLQEDFILNSPYDCLVLVGIGGGVCIEQARSSNS